VSQVDVGAVAVVRLDQVDEPERVVGRGDVAAVLG
jgi:hypothetical protein